MCSSLEKVGALPPRITMQSTALLNRDAAQNMECEIIHIDRRDWNLRLSSILVIFLGSALGALAPIWLARSSKLRIPQLCFFVAKYFGTGVIMATAFMHLLSPASESLRNECLRGILGKYDWAMAICLITIMVMFLIEILISCFNFGFGSPHGHGHSHEHPVPSAMTDSAPLRSINSRRLQELGMAPPPSNSLAEGSSPTMTSERTDAPGWGGKHHIPVLPNEISYPPGGEDHLGHQRDHIEGDEHPSYATQMAAIFILEFGVIFHSIFIGLALAVADNFVVLYIVLVFHQTFEGLALGSRLGTATWPSGRGRFTPYCLGMLYAVSTPLAIVVGLVTNQSVSMKASTSLIVNGVFDATSGGILMYTGLVELLAHEFMFNPEMRKAGLGMQLFAFTCVSFGVALMAVLAKWA
ncbi:putative transporter [Cladorrhinum samala]|uniref:Transporter n=1 Tax=Cladorrhinum samala TaxID=585594 RepID=A0AAV9I3K3_9PEZI|nr:putative transporter [Cladorrhinum samala]